MKMRFVSDFCPVLLIRGLTILPLGELVWMLQPEVAIPTSISVANSFAQNVTSSIPVARAYLMVRAESWYDFFF